jgi:polyhydroxyalkanoate synthase subunit PhaC
LAIDLQNSSLVTDAEITFLLTTGGHNAGIVSVPDRHDRKYQVKTKSNNDTYLDPDTWLATTPEKEGSWSEWVLWLNKRSAETVHPPQIGAPERGLSQLGEAPGTYVFQE